MQARYLRHGSAALLGPGRGGRAHAHLSVAEEQQRLARFAIPATHGGVVEASPVRRAYEAAAGHAVPKSTRYRLLSRPGWRKLAPPPSGKRHCPGGVPKKLRRLVRTEVQRQQQQGRAVRLRLQDEARLRRMQDPRRAGAPPGVRPWVPTEMVREYGYA